MSLLLSQIIFEGSVRKVRAQAEVFSRVIQALHRGGRSRNADFGQFKLAGRGSRHMRH